MCKRQPRPLGGQGGGSRLGRGEAVDKGLGLNAPAPADFQPHNDKTAAALGCKLRVDRDAFAPRSLGDGGCGGGGSMGVCRAIPANGANKGCVNRKLPCQRGRPCARISMARPSAGGGSRFMWARGTCMCTRAPASRRMRAKVLSTGTARVRKAPLVAHAARWSPNASKGRPQRQRAGANPNGRRSRRRSRVR